MAESMDEKAAKVAEDVQVALDGRVKIISEAITKDAHRWSSALRAVGINVWPQAWAMIATAGAFLFGLLLGGV